MTEGLEEELSNNQALYYKHASLKAIPNDWDLWERILSAEDP
jgi:hypothetical protein